MRKALEFIHAHYSAPDDDPDHVTLARVADHVSLSPKYLSQLFSKITGTTFSQYVTAIRIQHASEFIAENPYASITTAAYESGFRSLRTFEYHFKRLVGRTALEYRTEIRRWRRRSPPNPPD